MAYALRRATSAGGRLSAKMEFSGAYARLARVMLMASPSNLWAAFPSGPGMSLWCSSTAKVSCNDVRFEVGGESS